jgi:4-diphosphocytidyl-2-C-methyl-D-erythritol kinase
MSGSRPDRVARTCFAKINPFLEVLRRRDDGFHEVETVLAEIDLADDLVVERAGTGIHLVVEGDPGVPDGPENLVHRAAAAVLRPDEGVRIRLTKRVPAGAGLGGGSSDAAGTLRALDELFDLRGRGVDLAAEAAALGSDVPFFLEGGVAVCRGRGERVEPVRGVSPVELRLVLPGLEVSTKRIYDSLTPPLTPLVDGASLCLAALCQGVTRGRSGALFNRLEEAAFVVFPRLRATSRSPCRLRLGRSAHEREWLGAVRAGRPVERYMDRTTHRVARPANPAGPDARIRGLSQEGRSPRWR